MKSFRNLIDKTWEKLLVFLGVLLVLLPVSPFNMPLAYRDSGVFLYTGWRILNGEVPYRDIWDHKPPVIFYIDALGLAIANNSRWGVWLIELIALFAAAFLGFVLIKKIFGLLPSVFSLLLWLLSLVLVLQGGNLTTEYTLPLQFAALFLVYHADRSKRPDLDFFLIGLTGALAFFTKQTAVGIWIAIVIALTLQRLISRQARRWLREMGFILLAGSIVSTIVILFFGTQGALPQLWSAAFEFNFVYSARTASTLAERLATILRGVRPLTRAGLLQVALVGYVIAILLLFFRRNSLDKTARLLLVVGLIAFPLEFFLIALPGRTFAHYYMTLLPILALFAGLAVWAIDSLVPRSRNATLLKYLLAFVIAGFIAWISFDDYLNQVYLYRDFTRNEPAIEYIEQNTSPEDQVLLWGSETAVNYFAERKSPSRFVYLIPLQQEGYVDEAMINEFLDDILQNQPKFMIDTERKNPLFTFPVTSPTIEEKIASLEAQYCLVKRIDFWKVYQYAREGCSK
ncbi:MAG: ArnT family glycosyltransferase [Bacteroidota bacterium]